MTDYRANIITSSPSEPIDWDDSAIPAGVQSAMQEAADCFSVSAYRAAGSMIRLTVELIVETQLSKEQFDSTNTLHARLALLAGEKNLPADLIDGLGDLKLLGNDAVHITTRDFEPTAENVELAFDIVKSIVHSLYQQSDLVQRLRARKSAPPE